MSDEHLKWVKEYQCPGCIIGSDTSCYKKGTYLECDRHMSGTNVIPIGHVFLGMPKGFNRLGCYNDMILTILQSKSDWEYNDLNVPVWKKLNENGHTMVRGISPRVNIPFLHVYLEDCMNQIDCIDIDTSEMD